MSMFLFWRIVYIVLGIFFVSSLLKMVINYQLNGEFYRSTKKQYELVFKRHKELQSQNIQSRDVYEFEKKVRNKLNMHKKNETVLMIPDATPTPVVLTPTPLPPYQQWIDVFFSH